MRNCQNNGKLKLDLAVGHRPDGGWASGFVYNSKKIMPKNKK